MLAQDSTDLPADGSGAREKISSVQSQVLHDVTAATGVGYWDLDLATGQRRWFGSTWRLLGYDELTVPSWEAWESRLSPDEVMRIETLSEAARLRCGSYEVEYPVTRPDGSCIWIEERCKWEAGADGEAARLLGIMIDVTARFEESARAQETSWLLELATNLNEVGVWKYRPVTGHYTANRAYLDLFGCAVASHEQWREQVGRVVYEEWEKQCRLAATSRSSFEIDYPIVSTKGEVRWVHGKYCWTYHPNGDPKAVVATEQDCTDRMEGQLRLQKREAQLDLATRKGNIGLWDMDLRTGTVEWDGRHYELVGIEPQEFDGRLETIWTYVHPEDQKRLQDLIEDCLANRRSELTADYRFVSQRTGVARWVRGRGQFTYTDEGDPLRFVGACSDIQSLKEAELRLEASEHHFRTALATAIVGTWDWDLRGMQIEWKGAYEELLGFEPGQFDGTFESFSKRVHPDDLPEVVRLAEEAKQNRSRCDVRYRILMPDGSPRWLAGRGGFEFDENGEPIRMSGVIWNITEQKLAEIDRELFARVADRAPGLLFVSSLEGSPLFVNPAGRQYLGLESTELEHLDPLEFLHPDERAGFWETVWPELEAEGQWNGELRVPDRIDDRNRLMLADVFMINDSVSGRPMAFATVAQDITQRAAAQRYADDLNEELETRVAVRTRELMQANKEMEAFAYTVAHDLRSPLRSIMSTSMILVEDFGDILPEDARSELLRQEAAAERLASLLDDLLTLARLGRSVVNNVEFNLSLVAAEVADELMVRGWKSQVEFVIEPDMIVKADPRLMRLVVQNLFENACKFGKYGERNRIEFGRQESAAGKPFFVRDEGIGFDQQYDEKIFKPFERLVRDSDFAGTGIGLANVKRIIERHGGKIWVRSREGKGSTFFLSL